MNEDCLKLTAYFGERDRAGDRFLADALVDIYARHELQTSLVMRGVDQPGATAMTVLVGIGIGLLGGLGAIARFLLDGAVSARTGSGFPWGTLAVNATGSFALGLLGGAADDTYRLLGTGLLGAYTTFSTWMLESHRLGEDGRLRLGALNVVLSLAVGVAAVWLGRQL